LEFRFEYPIFLIVRTNEEIDRLKDIISALDNKFNKININNTWAISLEELEAAGRLSYEGMQFLDLRKDGIAVKLV
jgi:hypothetical protein